MSDSTLVSDKWSASIEKGQVLITDKSATTHKIPVGQYLTDSQIRWLILDDVDEVPLGQVLALLKDYKQLAADYVTLKYFEDSGNVLSNSLQDNVTKNDKK